MYRVVLAGTGKRIEVTSRDTIELDLKQFVAAGLLEITVEVNEVIIFSAK